MLGPLEAMAASMAGAISATVFRRWAEQRRDFAHREAGAVWSRKIDSDDTEGLIPNRLLHDNAVLVRRQAAIHHKDQTGPDLRVLDQRSMQSGCGSQDNVVQVAFPLPIAEHRIEPQFLENQVAFTISAANDAGDRLGNGLRGGLDEFGPW